MKKKVKLASYVYFPDRKCSNVYLQHSQQISNAHRKFTPFNALLSKDDEEMELFLWAQDIGRSKKI